jgi:predicted  nucleic acid-binding Zn-ribbon protein
MWQLLIVLTVVGNLVSIAVSIFSTFRRSPPLDKELGEYVRKEDCTRMMTEHDVKRSAIYSTYNQRFTDGEREFRELQRSLGRIEATSEATGKAIAALSDRLDSTTTETTNRIEHLANRIDALRTQPLT